MRDMKLRRMGNSLGTTFSKGLLQKAGLSGDEELEVVAVPGEIRLRRANSRFVVELTKSEATALATGKMDSKAAETALGKVRKLVSGD